MSSLEEKLQHFNEVILKDAASERDRILKQIKSEMGSIVEDRRMEFEEQAEESLRKVTSLAEREKYYIISKAVIESKQMLMKTRERIIQTVFNDARKKLEEFVLSDGYFPFLSGEIRKSCNMAGEGEQVIILSRADMERFSSRLDGIKSELPYPISFEQTGDDIIGGCRVLNKTSSILIDNTLAGKLEVNRDGFFEVCSLRID